MDRFTNTKYSNPATKNVNTVHKNASAGVLRVDVLVLVEVAGVVAAHVTSRGVVIIKLVKRKAAAAVPPAPLPKRGHVIRDGSESSLLACCCNWSDETDTEVDDVGANPSTWTTGITKKKTAAARFIIIIIMVN